jgi:hypothetical protein
MAKNIAKINFQLNNKEMMASQVKRLPEIKFLSPAKAIEIDDEKQ